MLVRTWNVFHGNTKPPRREAYLEEMVRLAVEDRPDVLCLQEVPAWALPHLAGWSGMQVFGEVAARPRLGPLPWPAAAGRALTSLHHGLLRSLVSGQANAILVSHELWCVNRELLVLNARRFRRAQARWLELAPVARVAWPKERRVCQALRLRRADGSTFVIGNLHATSFPADQRLADAELLRAAAFVDGLAGPAEPVILCGDFNVPFERSRTLLDLTAPEWGFSTPGIGIDHVLVRGLPSRRPHRWAKERRMRGDLLLSDHTPVQVRVG